ncbi:MAG: 4Fe-4S binding protein [Eubacteriaceae bacterium]|nr:4Fe-4S binding protein [Eubacteriaceae bacterium]
MSVKSNYLGLELENPVIISAGPWSRDGRSILKCFESGAAAVVTESIISDTLLDVRPRVAYNGSGASNIRLYSDVQIEGWEREMAIAKSGGGKVIASVSAHTPSEIAYLATKLEKYGADAIELSVSNPMRESLEVMASDPEIIYDMTKEVVDNIKIPVAVKLSQNTTNISAVAKAAKEAGAGGVSAINTVRCILGVDLEERKPLLGTYGGYSGSPIKPLGLASIATIAQTVDIPLSGIGGISDFRDALEYIMLGAGSVQVGTAMMVEGPERIKAIIAGIDAWCTGRQIDDVSQICGAALDNLRSFDEMKIEPATSTVQSVPCTVDCEKCIRSCIYEAISKEAGSIKVDKKLCTGCGLCTFVCPTQKLRLEW